MPKYTVNHSYRAFSDGVHYGPYLAGTVVELAETEAEWVNRDSPGALTEVGTKPKAAPVNAEEAPASETRPLKGGRNRRG